MAADPIAFIVNPACGTKRHDGLIRLIRRTMDDARREAAVHVTQGPGEAEALARAAAGEGKRLVVAVGGDGTVNEVGRGLLGTEAALGILPCGSGNGLARHQAIPREPCAALARLLSPRFQRMDVGRINGRPFFCTAGLGFDAHVSRCFAEAPKRGLASYVKIAVREFGRYQSTGISAEIAGERIEGDCYLLAFANASQYGNDAWIAPGADIADGLLDVCLIDRLPLMRALRVGYALQAGTLPASGLATYHTADTVRVSTDRPIGFHVDGDYAGEDTRFEVELSRLALELAA